jgi:hypothetical protein
MADDVPKPHTANGTWVVLGLLAIGVVAGLAGLKFRRFPATDPPAATRPAMSTQETER